jgi:hypothetical protein
MIRALFSKGQCGPYVWYARKGDKGNGGGWRDSLNICVGYGKLFSFESDGRNGERCIYLVCDFNARWLKDSNPLCYIVIVLSVEGKVKHAM